MMYVIDAVLNSLSLIDPTGTLILRSSIPSFLFIAGLSIREMKEGTKRFYNNVNSEKLKSIEEVAKGVALIHDLVRTGGKVVPT
jgi:hypothetical protein